MNARLQTIIDEAKARVETKNTNGREKVNVCIDTSSIARGGEETLAKIREVAEAKGLRIDIGVTGSWGFSWMEPTVTVRSAAGTQTILYANVTADRVEEFIEATVVSGGTMPELALGVVEGTATDDIALLSDHPWMKGQERRLMEYIGRHDPVNIDEYLADGGYEGFGAALELDAETIVNQVVESGLGGRAGGGFPAGRKWDFLRTATTDERYLICNADEGDPGAWVNRVILEGEPQQIIEGLLIAALATGSFEGYVYIRYEYPLAFERFKKAAEQASSLGLLGKDILGTGLDFEIIPFLGAGSYVCGEETGLIASIDAYRGMPRIKPPFPAQSGLWNKPTNVNNVETYANAPLILKNGPEWWAGVSDCEDKGTKMFTVSGAINQPGCVEIPYGRTMKELLENYAGGMKEGSTLKGFQPGGPLSGILPASDINLPLTRPPYQERGMFLGGGGVIFFDQTTSIIDLCLYFVGFCEDESCGRCTTCRGGTQRAVEILRRMANGGGRNTDIDKLLDIVNTLVWSNCLHGQFGATSVKVALKFFRDEFDEVIREKRDPTRSLPGLISYVITSPRDESLAAAKDICPTVAISESAGTYSLEDAKCIRCGACKELAPGAIEVRDRFAPPIPADVAAAGG